jgi:hypothetical protein
MRRGEAMSPTDPERDPLFRGLVFLMAAILLAALIFDAISQRHPVRAGTPATSSETTVASTMTGMAGQGSPTASESAEKMATRHGQSMKAFPAKTRDRGMKCCSRRWWAG